MSDKNYELLLNQPRGSMVKVIAEGFEVHGEHLVFLDASGNMIALFLVDIVERVVELGEREAG